ncbi:MAG TPA: hypothetical protein G4N96_11765 [Chloroflexi bacterium]|nr:hypothetical protein [Chloroflexota bacterium]
MSDEIQQVMVIVNLGDDALPNEINRATTQLYRQLLKSNADNVAKPRNDTLEAGAKGDPVTLGVIALGVGVAIAPEVVKLIDSWLKRRYLDSGSSIAIKLGNDEISFPVAASSSPAELEALTDRFVALLKKHSSPRE